MIRSFRDRDTQRLFDGDPVSAFQSFRNQAIRRLRYLNEATSLQELYTLRGNRLEALAGDRSGQHSVRINRQWRICFRWQDDGPHDVEIVDYH
ncbi:MAG: type II toxin-antitoxin system RelE/ParE family toxin [Chloroflexi bacterium]|nr:type II toxin-antitoxin system RelE/ParE family toxin [Chloroflexota bacterium]